MTLINGLVNVIIPVWVERNKTNEAKAAARREKIEKTTIDLLGELSRISNLTFETANTEILITFAQVYTDMLSKYYAWERAIWSKLNSGHRNDVRIMRVNLECDLTIEDIPYWIQ